jgi:hypothetical protein
MKNRTIRLATLLAVATCLTTQALERSSLLPPQADITVYISNTTDFINQLKHSSVGKLWMDDEFQNFIGNIDNDMLLEIMFDGEPTEEDRLIIEEMKAIKGEIAVGMGLEAKEPYIIAAMSKEVFLETLETDLKLNAVTENPFEQRQETFQDHTLYQYIYKAGTPDEHSSWQAHTKNTLLVGPSQEWVERTLLELNKEEITEPEGDPRLKISIPVASILNTSLEESDPSTLPIIQALGLMGIQTFRMTVELHKDQMVIDNHCTIDDLNKGLFALLDTEPSTIPTDSFIPENITNFEVGRFNIKQLWQNIPVIMEESEPGSRAQFDLMIGMLNQQLNIDVEQDLLTYLGTKYLYYAIYEGGAQDYVLALELKNPKQFNAGLKSMFNAPALQPVIASSLESIDFIDRTLYIPKQQTNPDQPIAFSVSDGYLLYGTPAGLRQAIRNLSSETKHNVAQTDLVKGLREKISSKAFGFSAVDWKKSMETLIHQLRESEQFTQLQQNWAQSGSPIPPPDMNNMPSASHIASFFNISYQYIEKSSDGLHQRIYLTY